MVGLLNFNYFLLSPLLRTNLKPIELNIWTTTLTNLILVNLRHEMTNFNLSKLKLNFICPQAIINITWSFIFCFVKHESFAVYFRLDLRRCLLQHLRLVLLGLIDDHDGCCCCTADRILVKGNDWFKVINWLHITVMNRLQFAVPVCYGKVGTKYVWVLLW